MAINYTIQADVVDITADTPKAGDVFLVDTNVWYWLTYTRASQSARPPAQYQTSNYPAYTNAALSAVRYAPKFKLPVAWLPVLPNR